jgi:hypothetical protein
LQKVFSHLIKFDIHVSLIILLFLSGCGYSFVGGKSSSVKSIKIGSIENKTHEPGLEDELRTALSDELMRHGVSLNGEQGIEITGSIEKFELRGFSEKEGLFSEYEIIINGSFFLKKSAGYVSILNVQSPFIVHFSSGGSMGLVSALKEEAVRSALRDFASEIAAAIVYK